MYLRDTIRRSGRSLKSAKGRTILTALAIAVGGFTLTITLAAGNGISDYTNKFVASNLDPAELIVTRDKDAFALGGGDNKPKEFEDSVASLNFGGGGATVQFKQVTDKDVAEIRGLSFAEQVRERYTLSVRYVTRPGIKKYTASAEAYNPAQKPDLAAGNLPSGSDLNKGEIVLPEDYATILGFKDDADMLGKTVTVNIQKSFSTESIIAQFQSGGLTKLDPTKLAPSTTDQTYTVAAVSKKSTTALAPGPLSIIFSSKDSRAIYDYEAKDTANYGKYFTVFVHVQDGKDDAKLTAARLELEKRGYFVKTSKDLQATINKIVQIFTALVGVFSIITLIASVFGIVNTQYISVLERTREIGLMKSLGMRSRDIRRLFMLEAGWIGFIGGLIGTVAGVIMAIILNPWIDKQLGVHFIFRPVQVVALIIALILIAILAGFFPARKAARLDPIEALRTE